MRRFALWLGRFALAAVALPSVGLIMMTLIAFQVGAVSAAFVHPGASGSLIGDGLLLSANYMTRTFQITGLILAYELYLLFTLIAWPFLLLTGDLRWGISL